jgi:hypothetical protein
MLKKFRNRTEVTYLILLGKYVFFVLCVLLILTILVQIFKHISPKKQVYYKKRPLSESLLLSDLKNTTKDKPIAVSTTRHSTLIACLTNSTIISNRKAVSNFEQSSEYSSEDSRLTLNSGLTLCPDDGDLETLKGPINVNLLLDEFNLTTLVSLHEPQSFHLWKNKYVRPIRLFYLDERNLKAKHKNPSFNEFWELWHTANVSVLNISKELLGRDGGRVELGGLWKPRECDSKHRIVIIIPFRDRVPHLRVSIQYLHTILQRQMSEYRIVVIEGNYGLNTPFNKGRIYNAGKYF